MTSQKEEESTPVRNTNLFEILGEESKEEHAGSNRCKSNDNVPNIGMIFANEYEAYKFYNEYAKGKGFIVRKDKYRRLADGSIRQRSFVCSKQGLRRSTDTSYVRKFNRLETRTGCLAMILFTIENGSWVISQFSDEHNHELVKQDQQSILQSRTHVGEAQANVIETVVNDGLKLSTEHADVAKSEGFLKSDSDNFIQCRRRYTLHAGDAQSLIDHFKCMQADDLSFFYTMQVDSEGRMTNFFLRDGRSKTDYSHFGDVVVFDTTYRTNKYNLVCAPFIGVNNHRQNILFGCAFLLDETTESFVWLFESFLQAMGGKQPKTIFTDQFQAMATAIEKVFPEAQHRLCLWHIGQNTSKQLAYYLRRHDFKTLFNRCLYSCETEQEFEEVWGQLLTIVDFSQSSWLKTLYDMRQRWCPAFSKNYFSAGIMSAPRNEYMNSVFHDVTSRTVTLTKLVYHYERVLEHRRHSELMKDSHCNQGISSSASKIGGMTKQAAIEYTDVVFQEFQAELFESLSVSYKPIGVDENCYRYELLKVEDVKKYTVNFRASDYTVECSCKNFESVGFLCLHALKVLNLHNIFAIPRQYILKRWTRGAKDGLGPSDDGNKAPDAFTKSSSYRMSQIMQRAVHFAIKGALTVETAKIAEEIMEHGLKGIERVLRCNKVVTVDEVKTAHENELEKENHPLCDPFKTMEGTNDRTKNHLEKSKHKRKIVQVEHEYENAMNGMNQSQKVKRANVKIDSNKHQCSSTSMAKDNMNTGYKIQGCSSYSFDNLKGSSKDQDAASMQSTQTSSENWGPKHPDMHASNTETSSTFALNSQMPTFSLDSSSYSFNIKPEVSANSSDNVSAQSTQGILRNMVLGCQNQNQPGQK